jgi:hypothetical protein
MRVLLVAAIGLVIAISVVVARLRAQRRKHEVPELNQHPERLDQMLDKTDDA